MKLFLFIIAINYSLNIFSQDWGLYQSLRGTENWDAKRKANEELLRVMNRPKYSCIEIVKYVYNYGEIKAKITNEELNSTWLKQVSIYEIDYTYSVLAYILDNTEKIKVYAFCDVSVSDLNSFLDQNNWSTLSYGERFNKYIFENKCNCQ